jgi:hypothetical protein
MYLEKIRGGAKFNSCWLHIDGVELNQEVQHIRSHHFFAATTCSQIRERNLLDKRARWHVAFCWAYCWLIMVEHHITHWLIDYWKTAGQLPVSLYTRATKFRPIISLHVLVVRLRRHLLIFQFHAFIPRLASYCRVVLTIDFCGKLSLGRPHSSCKISTLNYRQFFRSWGGQSIAIH